MKNMLIKKLLQNRNFYYLAYGSNLNLYHMSSMSENARVVGTTELNGYRLVFRGSADEYSYLTIEKCEGESVPLGIFSIPKSDLDVLDKYESYPRLYERVAMPVMVDGKEEKAYIYIMLPYFDYHLPSEFYLKRCQEGYEDFGFDLNILNQALKTTKDSMPPSLKKKID